MLVLTSRPCSGGGRAGSPVEMMSFLAPPSLLRRQTDKRRWDSALPIAIPLINLTLPLRNSAL